MPDARIPKQIVELQRNLLEFQKQAFDSTFNALSALQDQQRELMTRLLDGAPAVPGEMRQLLDEWASALETGREQFRDTVDRSFETVESYLQRLSGEAGEGGSGGGTKGSPAEAKRKE
jgi:hypothetical protein